MVRLYQRLSSAQVDEVWVRLRAGHAAKPTARALGPPTSTVRTYLLRCGRIRPGPRRRAVGRLRLEEREEISRGLAAGWSLRSIAAGSGDHVRHRLSRGGNRQINRVLHFMATVQLRNPTEGRAYFDRTKAEGKPRTKPCAASSDACPTSCFAPCSTTPPTP